ncbi:MAG: Enoyl-CoA hydratase (EC =_ degradation of branched-chain amino acids and alpha-keto acids [uncultured Paraburkholderia sp.]|nr:MAG: Enoyl-CoA hydratase (EC => degradation of branched-chain amino acids and alpha-keto acids [uncultured Paraburkholderia sp.]CAH2932947.1 MAG: Enoyl-CoA hydratase (EC => degradation of branched-chain amino acids and alpha-keto acids [uncultured Paraburkholderia sp.]
MINLEYVHDGAVALVTLKRPPANAFTPEGLLQLQHTVERLNGEPAVRAIVITGDGQKFFSAGANLNTFADGNREVAHTAAARFGVAFETLQNARPVVIAAINGYAMGGGLECALACDIRIAEQHAVLALPETAVGLLPCGCGTQTLPWLVEEVVEKGTTREAALTMAARVATLSPQAVGFSKTLIHQGRNGVPRSAALALERERFVGLFDGADQREGVNAFLEKRAPQWQVAQRTSAENTRAEDSQ